MTNDSLAVVGLGLCVPGGPGACDAWSMIRAGRSAARPFEIDTLPGWRRMACPIEHTQIEDRLAPHELRRLDRQHVLARSAADDAMRAVGDRLPPPDRRAISVGTGYGAGPMSDTQLRNLIDRGMRAVSPLTIPLTMPNSVAAHLALEYHVQGPVLTTTTACASGANAIGEAMWLLRNDRADMVLAGGVDALLFPGPISGFDRAGAMTAHEDDCAASRPFDRRRDGFVMGEGAGYVVLVRSEDAVAMDLEVHGSLLGYATNTDAHHIVAPDPDGVKAIECMEGALRDAGLGPAEIGHVNAHGTSTRLNDAAEGEAIRTVFGSDGPPVTATKGATGHMIGASAAVEAIVTLLACRDRFVPHVAGLTELDPEITVDVVCDRGRPVDRGTALSTSFAFGGHNAALVVAA